MSKEIPILEPDEFLMLSGVMEWIMPSDYPPPESRDRPYNGQSHTDLGTRGRTEIRGITFRDLRDCFVRACFQASGLSKNEWPKSLYDLPWNHMDAIAVQQNLSCEVEKLMGIFPNVPGPEFDGVVCKWTEDRLNG
jgi:hypothetical protein